MIYEFDRPMTLVTPYGTLELNEVAWDGEPVWPRYQCVPASCDLGWQARVTRTDIAAADGSILGKGFATGVEVNMVVECWEEFEQPACGTVLTEMMDTLRGHLFALLKDTQGVGRLTADVPDATIPVTLLDRRMVDDIQLAEIANPKLVDQVRMAQAFTLDSPFPYVMRANQESITINNTADVIVMTGTAWFMPVIKVYGPFSGGACYIDHNDLGVSIAYSDFRPGAPTIGAGEYLEIDTFRNVATKVAPGPVLSDAMAGIELSQSDFFPLVPGSNEIETNADVEFLINQAWQ